MKSSITIILLLLFGVGIAQKPTYKSNKYRRIIIVENDSTLTLIESQGCFGTQNSISYNKEDELYKVSGDPNSKQEGIFSLLTDLSGSELIVEEDSLMIMKTGEMFYKESYLDSKTEKEFLNFYLIFDNQKILIDLSNYDKVLQNVDIDKFDVVEVDRDVAKKKYQIDLKFRTLMLIPK